MSHLSFDLNKPWVPFPLPDTDEEDVLADVSNASTREEEDEEDVSFFDQFEDLVREGMEEEDGEPRIDNDDNVADLGSLSFSDYAYFLSMSPDFLRELEVPCPANASAYTEWTAKFLQKHPPRVSEKMFSTMFRRHRKKPAPATPTPFDPLDAHVTPETQRAATAFGMWTFSAVFPQIIVHLQAASNRNRLPETSAMFLSGDKKGIGSFILPGQDMVVASMPPMRNTFVGIGLGQDAVFNLSHELELLSPKFSRSAAVRLHKERSVRFFTTLMLALWTWRRGNDLPPRDKTALLEQIDSLLAVEIAPTLQQRYRQFGLTITQEMASRVGGIRNVPAPRMFANREAPMLVPPCFASFAKPRIIARATEASKHKNDLGVLALRHIDISPTLAANCLDPNVVRKIIEDGISVVDFIKDQSDEMGQSVERLLDLADLVVGSASLLLSKNFSPTGSAACDAWLKPDATTPEFFTLRMLKDAPPHASGIVPHRQFPPFVVLSSIFARFLTQPAGSVSRADIAGVSHQIGADLISVGDVFAWRRAAAPKKRKWQTTTSVPRRRKRSETSTLPRVPARVDTRGVSFFDDNNNDDDDDTYPFEEDVLETRLRREETSFSLEIDMAGDGCDLDLGSKRQRFGRCAVQLSESNERAVVPRDSDRLPCIERLELSEWLDLASNALTALLIPTRVYRLPDAIQPIVARSPDTLGSKTMALKNFLPRDMDASIADQIIRDATWDGSVRQSILRWQGRDVVCVQFVL